MRLSGEGAGFGDSEGRVLNEEGGRLGFSCGG